MLLDDDTRYRAVSSRDRRFDGCFFTAVTSTGIYCRPSCPALTPKRVNVRFFASAAAAQKSGFRACKRCRPDVCPGSPDWNLRADLVGRALRLIADGVIDRDGVPGLARRLGYSERQVNRTLVAEVGAGPLALARANRAQTARTLLETTTMAAADVAFAAGFASIRQFNETINAVFAETPSALRANAQRAGVQRAGDQRAGDQASSVARASSGAAGAIFAAGAIDLRLPYREPMDVAFTLRWLGWHAVAGVESLVESDAGPKYTRTMSLPHAPGLITLAVGGPGWVAARLELQDHRDLTAAVARVRRLLDLDADPNAVDQALAADPALAPLIARFPGIRSPGCVDGPETGFRTIVGQQVSLAGARAVLGRIVAEHGAIVNDRRLFPTPDQLAALDPATLPLPRARGRAVVALAAAVAAGDVVLDAGVDGACTRAALLAQPGIGPWTADYLAMRVWGDPDVLLMGDLAARRIAARLGLDLDLEDASRQWSPWRSYVTHHLWAIALQAIPARARTATSKER